MRQQAESATKQQSNGDPGSSQNRGLAQDETLEIAPGRAQRTVKAPLALAIPGQRRKAGEDLHNGGQRRQQATAQHDEEQ